VRALVVGAGIAGMATAIGLRGGGWDVRVVERWDSVSDLGTGLGIWPDAQTALERLGLVLSEAVPYTEASIRQPSGRVLAEFPLRRIEKRYGRPVVLVSRTALIRMLLKAVGEVETGVRLERPLDVVGEYDLVVAADGVRSVVRQAVFAEPGTPTSAGCVAWRGTVQLDVDEYGETWGAGRIFGITPVRPGWVNWYAAVNTRLPASTVDDLRAGYAGWHDPIPALLAADGEPLRHEIHDLRPPLPSYVKGKVVLAGDAAHATTPSLGQGACQALIDAECLTRLLRELPVADALAAYDRERRRPTQRLVARARTLSKVMCATRWTGLRDTAVRLLPS
jgi:2-polyprenyl-6-methoxyphenol hydroxylase-like FAD-dependent oxidoreductase